MPSMKLPIAGENRPAVWRSLAELEALPEEIRARVAKETAGFIDGLVSHYELVSSPD